LQVKFPDHYPNDLYEWQDFHKCTHFLLAETAAKLFISTVTQAHITASFVIPPLFSTLLAAAVVVKMEDTASILQDTLCRMENMCTGAIYQKMHRGAPAAYTLLPQQYSTLLLQQYSTPPPQQYSALLPQSHTTSTVPSSTGPQLKQKCHFDRCPQIIRDCPGAADYISAKEIWRPTK
jgi:hypothetical protein